MPDRADILVIAADPRIAAAAAGFLEPEGHRVRGCGPLVDAAGLAPATEADVLLVDWGLVDAAGGHLGRALRLARPAAWIVALLPAHLQQAEPAGWDSVANLPLARDSLGRALDGRPARDGTAPSGP